ncbi:MAG TPA: hypothetical protein ENJ23_00520 [Bacteroidetes bacterium]|nr:hypothetical protein [Bacteroidota bacterium]
MKQVMVIFNAALEPRVLRCIHECGIDAYTKIPVAYGVGHSSEPHMGTHIWPGENRIIFSVVSEEKIPHILERLKEIKQRFPREGLKVIVSPVDQMV